MRKKLPKIITIIFVVLFLLQIVSLVALMLLPKQSQAQQFDPQVDIGDYFTGGTVGSVVGSGDNKFWTSDLIGRYIVAIYKYAVGIAGILAAVVLMIGGVVWITAGGNANKISEAKAWIGASLTGLVLVMTSYVILKTVNPDLVDFDAITVKLPAETEWGCCIITKDGERTTSNSDSAACKKIEGSSFEKGKIASKDKKSCVESGTVCCRYSGVVADWTGIYDKCDMISATTCMQKRNYDISKTGKCTQKVMSQYTCE